MSVRERGLLGGLKDFYREQSKNYKILLTRGVVASFLNQLVQNFNNLYIVELGPLLSSLAP